MAGKLMMRERSYPFSWLDELIEVTLNPDMTHPDGITSAQLAEINRKLPGEIRRVQCSLKEQVFSLFQIDQVSLLKGRYAFSVNSLRKQATINLSSGVYSKDLQQTGEAIVDKLSALEVFIHSQYPDSVTGRPAPLISRPGEKIADKVRFKISVDQLGILIRAAFDTNLFMENSFRKTCKTIAPFLATKRKDSISFDSMRSNAGRPEQRDKDAAIFLLEKMILKIKDYD
jgi:hypothetical protein